MSTPQGHHVLVDAGPWSPGSSAAEFSILPYLERWGIRHLDAVVVTHPDEDHLGGVPTLLRNVSVGRIVRSGRTADTELYERVRRLIDQKGVPQETVRRGDTLVLDSTVRIQVLSPSRRAMQRGIERRNNASVVLRVTYGTVDLLLPGDVEAAAERRLVRAYGRRLQSRVVKVPHHGSSTSSTGRFVEAVSEEKKGRSYAVVSVGRKNRYGMPHRAVLRRWRRQGMTILSTARRGAVWMRTDGRRIWRVRWRRDF
ncbi:MAG: ComEC/Rec2 family competence protein [Salinibacter sp.]